MSPEKRQLRHLTEEEKKEKKKRIENLFNLTQEKIIEKLKEKREKSLVVEENQFGKLRIRRDGSWILDLRTISTEMSPDDAKKKKRSLFEFALENHTLLTEYEETVKITGREIEDSWEGSLRRYIDLNSIPLAESLLKNMQVALMRLNDPRSTKTNVSRNLK